MRAATPKALALTAILTIAAPAVVLAATDDPTSAPPAVLLPAAADGPVEEPSAETPADDSAGAYQTLSTLGALALGVLGLLWVRRHTAEL